MCSRQKQQHVGNCDYLRVRRVVFKNEEEIKLSTDNGHVIYLEKVNKIKILVHKNRYEAVRQEFKEDRAIWLSDLDPEDTREYDTNP